MNKKNTDKQSRNPIFDLLRIVLTVLVVNVHIRIITGVKPNFLEPFTWFSVPLFIVLSFFFTGNSPLIDRIRRLFIPFIFWSAIGFAIHPNLLSNNNIFLQLAAGDVVNTPLYYLVLLILFTLINWFINKYFFRQKIFIYSVIMLLALFFEYSKLNYNFFSPMPEVIKKSYGRFVELIKYVPIGLAFGYFNKKIINKNIYLILSATFLVLFFAFLKIPTPPDFHFSGLKTLTGSISIFSFILFLTNLKINGRLRNIINLLGKYSFGVYLSHYLLLEILLKVFPKTNYLITTLPIPFLIVFMSACYFLSHLFYIIKKELIRV